MALPNGAGGYQISDGNVNEIVFVPSAIPTAYTAAATLTTLDLSGGLVVYTSSSAANLTLPTATIVDTAFSSARVGSSFDFALIATSTGVPTVVVGTGWTLVGSGAGVASQSIMFRAVKTGDATYNLYRIAG
jgi:hypothetical protein